MNRTLRIIPALVVLTCAAATIQAFPVMNDGQHLQPKKLLFIENNGQLRQNNDAGTPHIDFKLETPGMDIFVASGALYYQWTKADHGLAQPFDPKDPHKKPARQHIETYRMDVVLAGAHKDAVITKEEQQAYFENYYLPQCPNGLTAHSYTKVTYKNIYPHIDWVLYSRNNELKYDFIVHPGGKAADIKLVYNGATALSMKDGAVTAASPLGTVTEKKPYSYDAVTKKEVPSSFVLKGNTLGFSVAHTGGAVVIDPSLAWGTYYGEAGEDDVASAVTTDNSGNVYMTGYARSDDEIATPGWDDTHEGLLDAYIVKFNTEGVRAWGTYYGASGDEYGYDIITDPVGALYVCGSTNSPNGMETPGTQQQQLGGLPPTLDAFIAKFDYNGQRIWGTYYGGTDDDEAYKLGLNLFGDISVCGVTKSPDTIATPGVFQQTPGGGLDAFVAKFTSAGVRVWGTYYGNIFSEAAYGMVTDANGSAYITGNTGSPDLVVTPNAHQKDYDTLTDAFFAKFDYNGYLQYATFFGGDQADLGYTLTKDHQGNIYMGGWTSSTYAIATPGSFKPALTSLSGTEGFLARFNDTGALLWSTYYGGDDNTLVHGIAVDPEDKIYIAGMTGSSTGIATPDGHQTTRGATLGWDAFLGRFDVNGNRNWGTYYGGIYNDELNGLTTDKNGKLFFCGTTNSPDRIATPGTLDDDFDGSPLYTDAFLVKFHDTTVFLVPPFSDTLICPPASFSVNYDVQVVFGAANTFTIQLSDANGSFANPTSIGSINSNVAGTINCTIPATIPPGTGYRIRVVGSSPAYASKDNGKNIRILERPKPTAAGTTPICEDDTLHLYASTTVAGVTYQWTGPGGFASGDQNPTIDKAKQNSAQGRYYITATVLGCSGKDSIDITIKARPYFTLLKGSDSVCQGGQLRLYAESSQPDASFSWWGPDNYTSTEQNPVLYEATAKNTGRYHVIIRGNNGCYSDSNYVDADVIDLAATIDAIGLKYIGDTLVLKGNTNREPVTYSWTGPNGFISNLKENELIDIPKEARGTYTLTINYKGCKATTAVEVVVSEQLKFSLYPNPNNGSFTIKGNTKEDQEVNFDIVNAAGQSIYKDKTMTVHKHFSKTITMPVEPAGGVYILRMDVKDKKHDVPFVIGK